jgi:DNA-binding GntR family transcriptional regulator
MPPGRRGLAKYVWLAAQIRDQIASGKLAVGQMTPSQHELRLQYRVARGTAEKALDVLAAEGLVEPVQGIGTRVIAVPAQSAEITVRPGAQIRARMPGPDELQAGANATIPFLVISRPGQPDEVHPADRAVILTTG